MVGMGEGCVVILAMGVGRGGWVMGGKPQLPRRRRRRRRVTVCPQRLGEGAAAPPGGSGTRDARY